MKNIKSVVWLSVVALLIITGFSSCNTQMTIARGTSFGHCVGFCNKELIVSKKQIIYNQWKNGDQPDKKGSSKILQQEVYNKMVSDFNFKDFYTLDQTIGCPDCADGGAEWIEVKKGSNTRRVTFEYGKAPEQIKSTVEQLNKMQAEFEID